MFRTIVHHIYSISMLTKDWYGIISVTWIWHIVLLSLNRFIERQCTCTTGFDDGGKLFLFSSNWHFACHIWNQFGDPFPYLQNEINRLTNQGDSTILDGILCVLIDRVQWFMFYCSALYRCDRWQLRVWGDVSATSKPANNLLQFWLPTVYPKTCTRLFCTVLCYCLCRWQAVIAIIILTKKVLKENGAMSTRWCTVMY